MNILNRFYTIPPVEKASLLLSKSKLPETDHEATAEEIIEAAYSYRGFGLFQSIEPSPSFPEERVAENKAEYAELANKVAAIKPKTVLEIGTARGGSLFLWARFLDTVDQICSLDLGSHIDNFEKRTQLFEEFANVEMDFVIADSHLPATREEIERRFDGQPIDFLLIDGDHSYEGVKSDFEMYKNLVSDDGLIAFHDIVNEEWPGVGRFWREIEPRFNTTEIIKEPERLGIGIVEIESE